MTVADLYRSCRAAGIRLAADGTDIAYDAPDGIAVPLADLRHHKSELLAILRGDYAGAALVRLRHLPNFEQQLDLAERFDERAGICQFDGGVTRDEAERTAYRELDAEVQRRSSAALPATIAKSNLGAESRVRESTGSQEMGRDIKSGSEVCPIVVAGGNLGVPSAEHRNLSVPPAEQGIRS